MIDFSKLDKDQIARLDRALQFLEEAKMPWSKQGEKNRQELRKAGGLSPEDAQIASAYRAYKYGITYKPLDPSVTAKAGIPPQEVERIEAERKARHEKESLSAYDLFVKPPEETMEPIQITAKAPKAKKKAPDSSPAATSSQPAAPTPPPSAYVDPNQPPVFVPVDSSIPGSPMQAGDPLLRQGSA
jgi:hypothetical protein